jgi:hypothetical protein
MDGKKGDFEVIISGTFNTDIQYLCRESRLNPEIVSRIVQIIKLAAQKEPGILNPVPDHEDKRFIFTRRIEKDGIPSMRVLLKIHQKEKQVELLAVTSTDVRL